MKKFKEIDSMAKEHDGHKILVLHQGLNDVDDFVGDLNVNDLPKNFTYYAIGDIHKNFEKKYDFLGGPLVYPGSIESASTEGIKEPPKGFYIIDISSEEAITKWIELDLRPRYVIEADSNKFHAQIEDLISKRDVIVLDDWHSRQLRSGALANVTAGPHYSTKITPVLYYDSGTGENTTTFTRIPEDGTAATHSFT